MIFSLMPLATVAALLIGPVRHISPEDTLAEVADVDGGGYGEEGIPSFQLIWFHHIHSLRPLAAPHNILFGSLPVVR